MRIVRLAVGVVALGLQSAFGFDGGSGVVGLVVLRELTELVALAPVIARDQRFHVRDEVADPAVDHDAGLAERADVRLGITIVFQS